MIPRLLQLVIVLFWLVTMSMLVQRTWFPDEARYPPVELSHVADLFFNQEDQRSRATDLAVFYQEEPLGRITLTPQEDVRDVPSTLLEDENLKEVLISGFLLKPHPQLGQLGWSASLYVQEPFEISAVRAHVQAPGISLSAHALMEMKPETALKYRIVSGGQLLVDSDDPETLQMLGLQLKGLIPGMASGAGGLTDMTTMMETLSAYKPEVDCRHGQFQILDKRYDGFILTLSLMADLEIRLLISELGELLEVSGVPDVQILSEAFVPQDLLVPDL